MKKITLLISCLVLFSASVFSQGHNHDLKDDDGIYKRVKVFKDKPNYAQILADAGADLVCGVIQEENYLQMELSVNELKEISKNGLRYEVLIEDMTKHYSETNMKELPMAIEMLEQEKKQTSLQRSHSIKELFVNNSGQNDNCSEIAWSTPQNFKFGTMGGCLKLSEMVAELDLMRTLYPNLISAKANASPTNQLTNQGNPIYYVRISDNPDSSEANEPQSLITGMTHAREVSSMMGTIYFMWYILENYSTDAYIKNLVDNNELLFIPVMNPDGLWWNEQIAPAGGGMQRKNLNPAYGSTTVSSNNSTRGVDINRNFGYYYGTFGDASGSSTSSTADAFRGTAAFSEKETVIIRDFVLARNIKTALNHHAYANILPHPVNGKANVTTAGRFDEYAQYGHDLSQYNRYLYGPAPKILYSASGDASDWMAGGTADGSGSIGSGKNLLSVSPESGTAAEGGFWTTPTNIPIVARRAMRMNFVCVNTAGKYAKVHDMTQSNISGLTGNLTFGVERIGQTDSDFTLTVTPVSSNIKSITSPATLSGMAKLEQRNVSAQFVLRTGIQVNEKIEYKVSLSNGLYTVFEATYVKYYTPAVSFNDNGEATTLTNWTASPANSWIVNTASALNGTRSISDTGTAYAANLNASVTTKASVVGSFAGASRVLVQFYAKWDLERNYDFVQIQGSLNGTSGWTNLCGTYTKPAALVSSGHATKTTTGSASFQNTNAGGAIYEGDGMDKWKMEEILIDANNNSFLVGATSPRFRFVLRTDANNAADGYTTSFDGFYFDDFKVIKVVDFTPAACSISTTWNGTDWSNGNPNKDIAVIISAPLTFSSDFEACSLTINNNAAVIVAPNANLTVVNKITVASGSLTVQNNANLIQVNEVVNSGNIIVYRNSSPLIRYDYTYWSSPVENQNLLNFSPATLTNRFYEYNEPSNGFVTINPSTNSFVAGKGFMIRAPNDYNSTPQIFNGSFTGVAHNGNYGRTITKTNNAGYNLLGNPYPSTISALLFLTANPGTLYFWTHNDQISGNGANYATYSTLGGTKASTGGELPNGSIQVGQGFLYKTNNAGTATFANSMRTGNKVEQFFRAQNSQHYAVQYDVETEDIPVEKHRFWLSLTNPANTIFSQALIGYASNATEGYDESIDGPSIAENSTSIASLIDGTRYAIQGRPLPFANTDVVALDFKALEAGTYSLTIDETDGLFSDQDIFLKDNLTGIVTNIKSNPYSFSSTNGNFNERFQIIYQNTTLGIEQPEIDKNSVIAFKKGNAINILSSIENISEVSIYDVLGRTLYASKIDGKKEIVLNNVSKATEVIFIKIATENGHSLIKKIL